MEKRGYLNTEEKVKYSAALGSELKALRFKRHLSLRQVMEQGVMNGWVLGNIEAGRAMPNAYYLQRLCKFYGISIDSLLQKVLEAAV